MIFNNRVWKYLFLICFACLVLGLSMSFTISSQASSPEERARPTITPTPIPRKASSDKIGAHIELAISPKNQLYINITNVSTVIQWQDFQGNWHDVEGWRGTLDVSGHKKWWVDQKDFAKGPFRWVVLSSTSEEVLGTSEDFILPVTPNEQLIIKVDLNLDNKS